MMVKSDSTMRAEVSMKYCSSGKHVLLKKIEIFKIPLLFQTVLINPFMMASE